MGCGRPPASGVVLVPAASVPRGHAQSTSRHGTVRLQFSLPRGGGARSGRVGSIAHVGRQAMSASTARSRRAARNRREWPERTESSESEYPRTRWA